MKFRKGDTVVHEHTEHAWDGIKGIILRDQQSETMAQVRVLNAVFMDGSKVSSEYTERGKRGATLSVCNLTLICRTCHKEDCVTLRSE